MAYSLKEINDAVRSDPKGFVEECDAAYARKIESAARRIADNRSRSRIVLLSGPSGSGKTTTALKIEEQLEKMGIQTHTISMDNYFNTIDPETAPRNREGNIDYESPFCLDIELLNRHFSMLDRGETIHVPKYEFARQMRSDILSQPLKRQHGKLHHADQHRHGGHRVVAAHGRLGGYSGGLANKLALLAHEGALSFNSETIPK